MNDEDSIIPGIPKPPELFEDQLRALRVDPPALRDSKRNRLLRELVGDPDLHEGWDMGPPGPVPDLRGKCDEEAAELMVEWFLRNFEDPAAETVRDDGDWVFVWGGPYTAEEEIGEAFEDIASDAAITAAIEKLEDDVWEWAPAGNRMIPEVPDDPVIRAKQRLHKQAKGWCYAANDDADPETAEMSVCVADVALMLREHRRLSKIVAQVKMTIEESDHGIK